MEEKKSIAHKTLDELKGRFIKRDINFMGARKVLLCISAALVVLSFAVVGVRGLQFGIEFVGGTSIAFHNTGDTSIEDMRAAFAEAGEPDAVVQTPIPMAPMVSWFAPPLRLPNLLQPRQRKWSTRST